VVYDLIIDAGKEKERIALLNDKQIVELHQEKSEQHFAVGEIYLGKVKKIMPGLNAAFVDVGYEKDAFLHFHDLGPQIRSLNKITGIMSSGGLPPEKVLDIELEPETVKTGKISDNIKKGQQVLVQIAKEPISSKGPRLSCEISLSGKYFVLIPLVEQVILSKKIARGEERTRLKNLALSLRPKGCGIIVRTAAEGKAVADLHTDLIELQERWIKVFNGLSKRTPPQLVLGESRRSLSIVRDMLSYEFNAIHVNDKVLFQELTSMLDSINSDLSKKVRLYRQKEPIFQAFDIEKQIKSSFGKTVNCGSGVYLVIEHTEALHSIDVNSGSRQNKGEDQETNALKTNMVAASEVARQLRLRDMGGIVVIDFVDLKSAKNKKQLLEHIKSSMADDRAKYSILPLSRFGLMEITRQRVRPELVISTLEKCSVCKGSGTVDYHSNIIDDINEHLDFVFTRTKHDGVAIKSNPFIVHYLKKGFPSIRLKWVFKYFKWVKLIEEKNAGMVEYKFLDKIGETIEFNH
jgi:ribonuclease G